MRHGKGTIKEATALIEAMRRAKVPAFEIQKFTGADHDAIRDMVNKAKRHHTIQTRYCSEEMTEEVRTITERKEAALEKDIREIAERYGLRAKFDGDPRGFTVKLHAPGGDVWNTWGGASTGYGIGDAE